MAGMKHQRQARLREVLLEQKRRLWRELREDIFQNAGEQIGSQFDMPQDPGEQSILDYLEDMQLSVADIRRQQLTQLDEAMAKLERGTYGTCEKCGREIAEERLRILPFATHCIDCQKENEGVAYPPRATL